MSQQSEIDMVELLQRVTRLEAEHELLETQNESVQRKLDLMITRFDKYEAKWGGVMMVISALLALILAFKAELLRMLKGV